MAAPGKSDFVLRWPRGRIEVIHVTLKSFINGEGGPDMVDSAGLAGAAPGESDFYFLFLLGGGGLREGSK